MPAFKAGLSKGDVAMKIWTLLLLRVSLGWLLVIWGADKVFNVEHGMAVANKFYFGFLAVESALQVAGALQILVGLAVVVGFARRWVYPVQVLLNGASLLAVMQSVIDPWSWVFEGSNALFYPS
jgi:uncharacterized membrane protein YphA (DoxX/SURF4 family)